MWRCAAMVVALAVGGGCGETRCDALADAVNESFERIDSDQPASLLARLGAANEAVATFRAGGCDPYE